MHHAMAVGAQNRKINELGHALAWADGKRNGVVDLAEPTPPLAIRGEEIKATRLAFEPTIFAESRRTFRFNQRTVTLGDEVHAKQKATFSRFEQVYVIGNWLRAYYGRACADFVCGSNPLGSQTDRVRTNEASRKRLPVGGLP